MNIVADENIPFAESLFSKLGNVTLVAGRTCSTDQVQQADALIVRSVTPVNEVLLSQSRVKFVGTCTIGTDHIDLDYLQQYGISFCSAPGCNAESVVQYVVCALAQTRYLKQGLKAAIVGCGNVGSRVYRALSGFGLRCVGIDPHIESTDEMNIDGIDAVYDADVICLHTPLVLSGAHPTENLVCKAVLQGLKRGALLLNAGRGECINQADLLQHLEQGAQLNVVLDVWGNEPDISAALFKQTTIGTPHIAGYSFEGKVRGALMVFSELARFKGMKEDWIAAEIQATKRSYLGEKESLSAKNMHELLCNVYDIQHDHLSLRDALETLPESFDQLRKHYAVRREFSHYQIPSDFALGSQNSKALSALGFDLA